VAVDQGGCIATMDRVTTHADPVFVKHGVIHYAVANMPGAVPRTSTFALNNATLRYGLMLANKGVERACRENQSLKMGLNIYKGIITYQAVAEAFGLMAEYKPVDSVLS
jgi:alanine dehydrogenase